MEPNPNEILEDLGLSEGEIKVYKTLLKQGASPVSELRKELDIHRTTIYDYLNALIDEGLVNYVVEEGAKRFKATSPKKLLRILEEKERQLQTIIPQLEALDQGENEDIEVEVYKGREGFKTLLEDCLEVGEDLVAFGVNEAEFKEKFPILMENYFRREEKARMKERILTSEETDHVYEGETVEYRYIPEKYFHSAPTMVYGDRVVIQIMEPLTIILIKNENLAEGYKKHFEMLWKTAEE